MIGWWAAELDRLDNFLFLEVFLLPFETQTVPSILVFSLSVAIKKELANSTPLDSHDIKQERPLVNRALSNIQ